MRVSEENKRSWLVIGASVLVLAVVIGAASAMAQEAAGDTGDGAGFVDDFTYGGSEYAGGTVAGSYDYGYGDLPVSEANPKRRMGGGLENFGGLDDYKTDGSLKKKPAPIPQK